MEWNDGGIGWDGDFVSRSAPGRDKASGFYGERNLEVSTFAVGGLTIRGASNLSLEIHVVMAFLCRGSGSNIHAANLRFEGNNI